MQGLLQQPPGPQQGGPAPQQGQGPSQEKYDVAAGMMIKWVYENAENVVATVEGGEPVERAGKVISQLMDFNRLSAQNNGKSVEPEILFQGAMETAQAVGEVLLAAGVLTEKNAGQAMEDAFFHALELQGQNAIVSDQERQTYLALIDEYEGGAA